MSVRGPAVLWGLIAAVAASILLAPVMTVGWCDDAPVAGASACFSEQRSILGASTNVWVWLGALALIAVATVVVARARPRS